MTVGSATTTYAYNALDQLTSAGAVTYDYDARGNMWHRTSGSDVTTYTYNAADQLTNVSATGINATYAYDADGRRVKQTIGSAVTNFLWDEASPYGDVVLETDANNAVLARYILGGTQLISQTRGSTTNYFLQDGQGSTRALTNSATGAITDTYSYTAFGESFATTGTTVNPYRYTGQQLDTSTGLYDLRARYYSPTLGRFLSQDTYPFNFSNPVELNRYVYAANNPINLMDPTGHNAATERGLLNFFSILNSGSTATAGYIVRDIYIKITIVLLFPFADLIGNLISVDELANILLENILAPTQTQTQTQTQVDVQVQPRVIGTPMPTPPPTPTVDICERNRQEYEATIKDLKFVIFKIQQIKRALLTTTDPELINDLEGQLHLEMINASNLEYGARLLLHQSIMLGCYAGLWSPIPILP